MGSKYYKLSDLKKGMVVSLGSLSKIVGTCILLDSSSCFYENGMCYGKIAYIGNDFKEKGIDRSKVAVVYNCYDATDEEFSEE